MLTITEREVGEGETNWGQAEERDITEFEAVGEVQLPQVRAIGTLKDMPHSQVRHPATAAEDGDRHLDWTTDRPTWCSRRC